MRVLVCGGRDYDDVDNVYKVLDDIDQVITCIISGHANGADSIGEMYANERNFKLDIYPADWNTHGRAAGPIRNKQMLDEGKPDLVVAFPGGRGTANMIKQAKQHGIEVKEITNE